MADDDAPIIADIVDSSDSSPAVPKPKRKSIAKKKVKGKGKGKGRKGSRPTRDSSPPSDGEDDDGHVRCRKPNLRVQTLLKQNTTKR